jgi:hypothetical protein
MVDAALKRRDPLARLEARLDRWCYIKKGGGSKAPVPDPTKQIEAEAAANRYNVNSPFGTQTWSRNGDQWTQNVTLNPSEQRQYDSRNAIAEAMMGQAQTSVGGGVPGYSDRPQMSQLPANYQGRGDFSSGMSDPGSFSLNQSTPEASKAHYARIAESLDPTFEKQTRGFEQRMSNAGIPVGSEAYNDAYGEMLDQQNRSLRDAAYESAEMAPQLALAERGQQMSDRGQLYGEGLSTRQQNVSEDLAAQEDARAGFSQSQSEQTRVFDEDLARRQQYYNELAALLGGQQLNPVNGGGGGGNAPLDVGSAYNAQNQAQLARYNAGQAQQANMMNGMFNLGSAALGNTAMWSDERLKDDVEEVGELPTGETLYEYHYKWEDESTPKHTGVMAQELEETQPDAVIYDPSGFRKVDYRKVIARALMAEAA